MNRGIRWIAPLVMTLLLIPVLGRAETVTISASVVAGTRTLAVKSVDGGTVSSVTLGAGGTAGFMVDVRDLAYSRSGYQVSASLSDLYQLSGSTYDCTKKIPASSMAMGFLASPISLTDVAAVATPVWDLTGQLTGALATTLGTASPTAFSVANLAGTQAQRTRSGVYSGTESVLPVTVAAGTGGAFALPAAHAGCAPAPAGSPTTRLIMSGGQQNQAALFTWVQDGFRSAADQNSNGTITGTELLNSGSVGSSQLAEATRTALGVAGVNLALLDTLVNAGTVQMSTIYAAMTATLDPITSLAGQSGTYVSLPKLTATIPTGTGAGTYTGTMTVTLVDL